MKRTIMTLMSAVTVLAVWASTPLTEKYAPRLTTPRMYEAFRTTGKIKIDGRLNEGDWTKARQSEPFTDIRGAGYPEPVKDTYVKMMWDDENLYIGARLQEDNIIAKLSQRDTIIYHDNDFEVFLDPDGDAQNYFEIENNARGVVFDLLLDKPYRSGGSFFVPWNCEGLQLAVSHDGTLNKPSDKDRAWYVEMAIPFDALRRDFTDPRSLKVWRINFSRVQWLVPGQPEENWVWSPTGKVDMHMPERWGFLHFVDAPVGSAAAAADYNIDMDAYRLLWSLFYEQQERKSQNQEYFHGIGLSGADMALLPAGGEISVDACNSAFEIAITVPSRNEIYSVNHDGKFRITPITPSKK